MRHLLKSAITRVSDTEVRREGLTMQSNTRQRQVSTLTAGLALSCILLAGCSGAGAQNQIAPTQSAPSGTVNVGQSLGTVPPVPGGWKRPLDVTPASEQGKFKVIAQEPAPGDKGRVFFLGAQF